ncbi:unnamed protein product [Urochloa humidicola]
MSGSLGAGAPQGRRARRSSRDSGRAWRRPSVAPSRVRDGCLHRAAADPDPAADFMATISTLGAGGVAACSCDGADCLVAWSSHRRRRLWTSGDLLRKH